MLVLCNSMCKSASSVLFWYTRQLFLEQKTATAQHRLRELTESGEVPGVFEFVEQINRPVLSQLLDISKQFGPLIVKTHSKQTPELCEAIESGHVKMVFSYRDPRDMILSAIDHQRRCRETNRKVVFKDYTDVIAAIPNASWWCEMACEWLDSGLPITMQYREIVCHPEKQIKTIAQFLDVEHSDELIARIVDKEFKRRQKGRNEFNQGKLLRYPLEMTREQREACNRELGDYISRLGFFVNNSFQNDRADHVWRPFQRIRLAAKRFPFLKGEARKSAA